MEKGEGRGMGERGEGAGHGVEAIGGGLGGDFALGEAGFESPGTAHPPERGRHPLDHAEVEAVGRLEAIEVILQQCSETFGRLLIEQDATWRASRGGSCCGRNAVYPRVSWGRRGERRWCGRRQLFAGTTF